MAKKEMTVICNYPTPENMEKFQEIMCNGLAKALIACKPPEYIEALKRGLEKAIELDKKKELEKNLSLGGE